jgi:hypothetical protein
MAVLGHRSANMAMIYARISDPEVRRQYESALANGNRIAGPAAEALLSGKLEEAAVQWLQTNILKTQLELGHCLRLPAEGPCECDLALNCPKFLTTSEYAPRLRARLETEQLLIDDAHTRGWEREVERHQATSRRLRQLLAEVDPPQLAGNSVTHVDGWVGPLGVAMQFAVGSGHGRVRVFPFSRFDRGVRLPIGLRQ